MQINENYYGGGEHQPSQEYPYFYDSWDQVSNLAGGRSHNYSL